MKAIQFSRYGDPDVLELGEASEPHPAAGQIRVRVKATSVNAIDWKIRSGLGGGPAPVEPVILGFDAAGYVDEVGAGVSGVAVGDEVFGLAEHGHAEYAVLKAWTAKPPSVDWAVAAAAGVATTTAVRVLDLLAVGAGSTVFVDGGAGGVGSAAVQIAVARGAGVIASGGARNDGYLREIGAVPVRYGEGVADRVRAAAGADTVDAVFDVAGKTPIEELLSLVDQPGQVLTIANFAAGGSGARVSGGSEGDSFAALAEVARLLADGRLVIQVQTFPFDRGAEAHRLSQGGHVRGKLVLLP